MRISTKKVTELNMDELELLLKIDTDLDEMSIDNVIFLSITKELLIFSHKDSCITISYDTHKNKPFTYKNESTIYKSIETTRIYSFKHEHIDDFMYVIHCIAQIIRDDCIKYFKNAPSVKDYYERAILNIEMAIKNGRCVDYYHKSDGLNKGILIEYNECDKTFNFSKFIEN